MQSQINHLNEKLSSLPDYVTGTISNKSKAMCGINSTILIYRPGRKGAIECADYSEALEYIQVTAEYCKEHYAEDDHNQ